MNDMSVSVIIPAYNEAKGIGGVLDKLVPLAIQNHWEVIVVDDGSLDETAKIVSAYDAIKLISHDANSGYGASLRTGILASDSEFVVFIDSDGQHKTEDIKRLLTHIKDHDMIVGARTSESHVEFERRFGKIILKKFANYLAKKKIPDINSGLRAFRREAILAYLHLMPKGFSFSTTSTFAMLKGDHRIKWIPITTEKRVGKSTVKQIKHGSQTIMLMLRLTVLFDPLRVFLPVSGLLLLLAMIMTALNIIMYRFAIPAVMLAVTSVMIFMLGLVTDQISAIRREMHKKF